LTFSCKTGSVWLNHHGIQSTRPAVPGGSNHGRGIETRQRTVPGPSGWGLGSGPITRPLNILLLRKLYELENMPLFGATVVYTLLKKAKHDDLGPKPRGCSGADQTTITPRSQPKIGNWNVRTMYFAGKSAQAAR